MSRLLTHKGRLVCGVAMFLTVSLCSCIAEHESVPETGGDREAAFILNVPGMNVPLTRALDSAKEQEVTEIDVVIFNAVDRTLAEYHRVGAADLTRITGGNGWRFKIHDVETTSNITVAVIANASLEVAEALEAVTDNGTYLGASKKAFLEALEVEVGTKWSTMGEGFWKIPMYGEAIIGGNIYSGTLPEVSLTRMLAKVDIVNNVAPGGIAAAGDFKLTAVHVVNYNTRGRIAPVWDNQGDILPIGTTVNLPADTGKRLWSEGNELIYIAPNSTDPIRNEIYLFEAAAMDDNTTTPSGLRLVLEGEYTSDEGSEVCYYPVDFTALRNTQTGMTAYIPVLRNNYYLFTIIEASGRGYGSMSEAVRALGVMSNLRTRLLTVDDSGIRSIVWNGEYFLGMADDKTEIGSITGDTASVACATNYDWGWEIDGIEYEGGQSPWLQAGKSGAPGIGHSNLELTALSVNGSGDERTAIVRIRAGRLTHKLTVVQPPFEGVLVGRFGGKLEADANGVWQYEKMLYVQGKDEGDVSVQWKTANTQTSDVESDWNGKENTWHMTSLVPLRDAHPAARLCYNKNGTEVSLNSLNWFLPAQKQLMAVWVSYSSLGTMPAPFQHKFYWSSTAAYGISNPWNINLFSGAVANMTNRASSNPVRCVTEY